MIYSDFLVEMRLPSFGERSLQIHFFVEICLRFFLQTLFFKDSLVEISSENCFVGISFQRMVNMSLQRVLWEIILFIFFGRECLFTDSLFIFSESFG